MKLNDWQTYNYGYFVVKRGWYNGDYFWKVESNPNWNIDLTQTFTSYNSDIASEIKDQCTSKTDRDGKTTHTCLCQLRPSEGADVCAYLLTVSTSLGICMSMSGW